MLCPAELAYFPDVDPQTTRRLADRFSLAGPERMLAQAVHCSLK